MSADEVILTLFALVVGPVLWAVWLWQMARIEMVRGRRTAVTWIAVTIIVAALLILFILDTAASSEVVDAPKYEFMYVVLGLAWIRHAQMVFPYLGLSPRDDAIERRNGAAAVALAGAILGVALCYAGGNIGNGPGWWVVVFSATLATGSLMGSWAGLARFTTIADAVTVDRDPAAGIRLASFLLSCGLVLGRGVAGDWISAGATVVDLAAMFPAIAAILALAVIVEALARPMPRRPRAPIFELGILPSLLYLFVGAVAVWLKGWPA